MAALSFSPSDGTASLWKRVNTNNLTSVDDSLVMNVFQGLAWKVCMLNANRMAPKISVALAIEVNIMEHQDDDVI